MSPGEPYLLTVVVADVGSPPLPTLRLVLEARRAWNVGGLTVGVDTMPRILQRLGLRPALEERARETQDPVF